MGWTRKRLWWFRGNIIMIVKMKFLAITGPRTDIDRVVSEYLSRYEIHLENAMSELQTVKNLRPFIEVNPYKEWISKADGYLNTLKSQTNSKLEGSISLESALNVIKKLDERVGGYNKKKMNCFRKRQRKKSPERNWNRSRIFHMIWKKSWNSSLSSSGSDA